MPEFYASDDLKITLCSFTKTDYLETFSANPGDIYGASNVDDTMKNAFTQTRKFLMAEYDLSEAEAWTLITQGVDFGVTQLVDGNWGIHSIIPKAMFEVETESPDGSDTDVGEVASEPADTSVASPHSATSLSASILSLMIFISLF